MILLLNYLLFWIGPMALKSIIFLLTAGEFSKSWNGLIIISRWFTYPTTISDCLWYSLTVLIIFVLMRLYHSGDDRESVGKFLRRSVVVCFGVVVIILVARHGHMENNLIDLLVFLVFVPISAAVFSRLYFLNFPGTLDTKAR